MDTLTHEDEDGNLKWRKSSWCAEGQCLEMAETPDGAVNVRDNTNPDKILEFERGDWQQFVKKIGGGAIVRG